MWFKNLNIFRLDERFLLTPEDLEEKLTLMAFRPCGAQEASTFGWTPPLGKSSEQRVHSSNGFMMLCGKNEERVLPTAVVNDMTQEKIAEMEVSQERTLGKKERNMIKDEVIFELLPRAFTLQTQTFAYLDPKAGWLIVDSASTSKAEDLLSSLRKCLGSLPATPISKIILNKPVSVMTSWLTHDRFGFDATPEDITIGDECELRAPEDEGGIIRCKNHDLSLPEIKNHLETGKQVFKLAVTWSDRLSFIIDDNLAIKRLKFLDLIQSYAAETETESEAERFDVDFSIMSLELVEFLPRLIEIFGGEVPDN
jgi:recombination associated protein RdgC